MRRFGGGFTIWALAALSLAAAQAQQTPQSPTQASPVGPVGGEANPGRIALDVLVQNKAGNPVTGLAEKDITVLDNGQPRKLTSFREVDAKSNADAVHILVVVDMVNTSFNEVSWEREQITEFLKQNGGKLPYPTAIGVMTDDGVRMMPGYSKDGMALLSGFQKFNTDLRYLNRSAGFWGATERLSMSLQELGQIANAEASHPGRKMMLVVSPGWPMLVGAGIEESNNQRKWVFNAIVEFTTALRDAHIALYALNPYLLGRTDPFYYKSYLKGVRRYENAEYPDLALQVLAEHSGGRAVTQGRDVLGEIQTATRDAGSYYEVSFEEPAAEHPDEYHEIQVKVDQPDVTARTNTGYYANVQPTGGKPAPPTTAAPSH